MLTLLRISPEILFWSVNQFPDNPLGHHLVVRTPVTVRFSEAELKEQQQAVKSTLLGMIQALWKKAVETQEKQKKNMQKVQELAGETKISSVGMIVEAGLENRPPMLIEAPPPEQP